MRGQSDALRIEFGVKLTPQGAEAYDPTKHAGRRLSERWRVLFETNRERFLVRLDEIPESHKAVRVKMLARAANNFESRGNYLAMANLLEKIAREMGGAFTNRHEYTGRDRGPNQFADVASLTDEQLQQEFDAIMAKARGRAPLTTTKH